jgi:Uma2 family endonuclease
MSMRTPSYVDAIERLPPGAMLILPHVAWDEYEQLLEELGDRPGVRVTYTQGRLEIMSPSEEHEQHKELILAVARVLSEELGLPLETRGSATRKHRGLGKGVEPDTSFYVANAHRVIGRRAADPDTDPPPDVVVEVDVTHESRSKLPVYAAFGVPEIWRYDGTAVEIYVLAGTEYASASTSRAFPELSASLLLEFLELGKHRGQSEALRAFRRRIREKRPPA